MWDFFFFFAYGNESPTFIHSEVLFHKQNEYQLKKKDSLT
jgi:hypothetical protein